jgi:hypothetical protein
MSNLTGTTYLVSTLWLSWKFKEKLFGVKLIIIKCANLGWISLNWRNDW